MVKTSWSNGMKNLVKKSLYIFFMEISNLHYQPPPPLLNSSKIGLYTGRERQMFREVKILDTHAIYIRYGGNKQTHKRTLNSHNRAVVTLSSMGDFTDKKQKYSKRW